MIAQALREILGDHVFGILKRSACCLVMVVWCWLLLPMLTSDVLANLINSV